MSLGEIFWEFRFLCKDLLVWMTHSALFRYWCQSWDFPLGSITGFSRDMLFLKLMCYGTAFIMLCVFVKSWFHICYWQQSCPYPTILPKFWNYSGWRLDLSGVDCFSLTPSDSVFGLKLIFTANWNKFASSIKKLIISINIFFSTPCLLS